MAGYGFDFSTKQHVAKETKDLLRAFQFLGKELGLEVHYKTKRDNGDIICHVDVDGALESMQILESSLYELIQGRYRFDCCTGKTADAKRYIRSAFLPMTRANKEALDGMTGSIEHLVNVTRGTMTGVVATLKMRAQTSELYERCSEELFQLVTVWDETRRKLFQHPEEDAKANVDQAILLDQSLGIYLKCRLDMKRKADFPNITDSAVKAELITPNDKLEMDRFHTKRNKAQHQNKPVSDTDLYNYLVFLSQVLNSISL